MLIGEFKNQVGEKNRVAFPKKFREELGEKLIVTQGYEGCLVIVSPFQWQTMIDESSSGPFVSQSVRDTSRFLLGGAAEVELDDQGRFVISPNLIEYAQIKNEIIFLGLSRWVEVWDAEKWLQRKQYIVEHSSEIADKLSEITL
ncbi:division/cell wall cluster transcriptional repressor MraZ [candidate division WWE3 bacterium CG06_land_8_20_14_3_00_42_16]|uniref:Transcriptional regulator MraZ n=3 Tax=Katanobacteria TaxID=422282 RepID=A0A2M7ALJ4_UNCKA|nr:MAG: division/cell wall cluster transcriptional repressor MraZ [candidate division WWE3 bacterium CG06_land_8_20_14_3_00_42_16]PIZ42099.1 MAG: division/cell wall cluster transcriptional repressor MraZ [candidate division WWE3 bacterium CG_4_10_14_0_2_um_filter_42_8]PJC69401.1 MAG: division/cell wall cluster transcriptional repressor MraZ [candidate division WWE3 bacterium CG_4_8_14_3_um_filter_42_11]